MNNNHKTHTIAFYNIENLFDIKNNPSTNDTDFLPTAPKQWTKKRYDKKVLKIGNVISKIGDHNTKNPPIIIGLAEVENKNVLEDLIQSDHLKAEAYSFVHFDSPDERGIDVALLYKGEFFTVMNTETFSVYLEKESGEQDYTRDILLVQGVLNNETINIIVNHWSSRREGLKETESKRLASATVVNKIIMDLKVKNPNTKFIVMGDFNDNPNNNSLALIESESNLYNPFKTIWSRTKGSLSYNFQWNLFDQILFSTNFFDAKNTTLSFTNADVFNAKFLAQAKGKYKGQPLRTFVGKKYKGGYSDHFPVFIKLKQSE